TNEELEEKARLLSEQNVEVERRTREIEQARRELEQKAEQLALTSKYKSQFLANMSHELRTPLNSLLLLAKQLEDNPEHNLTSKQVEFAMSIRRAGADLLDLINDILDLSKIESGMTPVEIAPMRFSDVTENVERTFRSIAQDKGLSFKIQLASDVPETLDTDSVRLMQILKNLLSNAFKFTQEGAVTLSISTARRPDASGNIIPWADFAVVDTGIGIHPDKHKVIFEAFQQEDMSTARKFGGTGLGLAISREIAGLLGGEISVESTPGAGSTFTFSHPLVRPAQRLSHVIMHPVPQAAAPAGIAERPPVAV